tara:strand:- start:2495 stop:3214 length:720 start_codon:yes stop_codon:yes gene_type:complete
MTPFDEVEPISFKEFMDTIRRNTGIDLWMLKAMEDWGHPKAIPTEEWVRGRKPIQVKCVGPTANLKSLSVILKNISLDEMSDWRGMSNWATVKIPYGWFVYVGIESLTGLVRTLSIVYVFRKGEVGDEPPDDEENYYVLGNGESLGWHLKLQDIVWGEEGESYPLTSIAAKTPKGEVYSVTTSEGISLLGNNVNSFFTIGMENWNAQSPSSDLLKQIFQHNHFSNFLNWDMNNPMDVKQ